MNGNSMAEIYRMVLLPTVTLRRLIQNHDGEDHQKAGLNAIRMVRLFIYNNQVLHDGYLETQQEAIVVQHSQEE